MEDKVLELYLTESAEQNIRIMSLEFSMKELEAEVKALRDWIDRVEDSLDDHTRGD